MQPRSSLAKHAPGEQSQVQWSVQHSVRNVPPVRHSHREEPFTQTSVCSVPEAPMRLRAPVSALSAPQARMLTSKAQAIVLSVLRAL